MHEIGFDALITAGTALPVGAWLKWAAVPVILAFGAGKIIGRALGRREAGRHARTTAAR